MHPLATFTSNPILALRTVRLLKPLSRSLDYADDLEVAHMALSSDLYETAAQVYIRMVERDSSDAAAAIKQILANFGARAALRAALIIQLLKIEVGYEHHAMQIGFYAYLLHDYPEVIPLLEQAVAFSLRAWGIYDVDVQLQDGNRL
jgi:hypothetical protein